MTGRKTIGRVLLGAGAALLGALSLGALSPLPARAAIPVFDISAFTQTLLQIEQTTRQIDSMKRQVRSLEQSARLLRPRSHGDLLTTLNRNLSNYTRFQGQLTGLGYTFDRLNSQFERLYPTSDKLSSKSPSELRETNRAVNQQLRDSTLTAMRAQTTLSDIQRTNQATQSILRQSQGNQSQVAQIQLAMQMLTVMDRNLHSIIQTVSTAGRVTSSRVAADVTRRRVARERKRRDIATYGNRGRPTQVDSRFLGP